VTRSVSTLPPLAISLFGPFDARVDGHPLPRLRSRKGYWLLALLALRHGREVERSWLAGTLWPDSPEPLAFASLRKSLRDLRRALGPQAYRLCSPTPRTVSLDVAGADVDVVAFDTAVARGDQRSLEEAVALYRGALLEGWAEEWVFQERQEREEAYLRALEQLAAGALASADRTEAARYLRLAIAADPTRETTQRELMAVLAAGGNYAAALESYRALHQHLHREQNVTPAPETTALYQRIRTEARKKAEGVHVTGGAGVQVFRSSGVPDRREPSVPPEHPNTRAPEHPSPNAQDPTPPLEPVGGAVPLGSPFYIVRPADEQFRDAIARQDSIVLVKGPRHIGKTSLLARGLHQAREAGARWVLTDFQKLTASQIESSETLFFMLAEAMADQLELDVPPESVWNARRGWNVNFERYLRREVLGKIGAPLIWGLDEVDRLFPYPFSLEVFGLFRAWHNERSLDPSSPWSQLTLAISYATEAHLFITDLDQSPFNVGTRLALADFTREQVAELNQRYGSPLQDETAVERFCALLGGHPYLVRRGLHEMVTRGLDLTAFEAQAEQDEGLFGDHLRQMLLPLSQGAGLCDVVRGVLRGGACPTTESFYRLRSAGVIAGDATHEARLRCRLYATYLQRHLG
jgi:DNA-binding SARP family transcriptional activator